jgi:hypothetical protein
MSFKFNLGDKVKHNITGFVGVITSRTEWLNGCKRYGLLSPALTKEGKVRDVEVIDEQELTLMKAAAPAVKKQATGGPQSGEAAIYRSR